MAAFHLEIAGAVAAVTSLFESTPHHFSAYLTEKCADFSITVTEDDLRFEQFDADEEAREEGFRLRKFPDPFLERAAIQRKFAEFLLERDTVLLHGSAVAVNGQGYLFSAKSGTGKSTHVRFWQQLLGQEALIINDDKPFFRITPTEILVCGSPWNGKHGLDTNITVPLKGICFLRRGSENRIWKPDVQDARTLLRANGCPPLDPVKQARYFSLLDTLAARTALWSMECTKDPLAARIAYEAMSSQ